MVPARIKVSKEELAYLKSLSEEELLFRYTLIARHQLDQIKEGENFLEVVDRGKELIPGELIDNSIRFTTEKFELTKKDLLMEGIIGIISVPR